MDEQTLERLLIDDAAGELDEDMHALLAEHLSKSPTANPWPDVIAKAREAIAEPSSEPEVLPRLTMPRVIPWRMGIAIAASWIIGLGIGLLVHHASPIASPAPTVAAVGEITGVHGFWSSSRLVAAAMDNKHSSRRTLAWSSPVRQPELEGAQ